MNLDVACVSVVRILAPKLNGNTQLCSEVTTFAILLPLHRLDEAIKQVTDRLSGRERNRERLLWIIASYLKCVTEPERVNCEQPKRERKRRGIHVIVQSNRCATSNRHLLLEPSRDSTCERLLCFLRPQNFLYAIITHY